MELPKVKGLVAKFITGKVKEKFVESFPSLSGNDKKTVSREIMNIATELVKNRK
jgi:hypothetical protein